MTFAAGGQWLGEEWDQKYGWKNSFGSALAECGMSLAYHRACAGVSRMVLKLREKITAGDRSGDPSAKDEDSSLGVGEIAGEWCIK